MAARQPFCVEVSFLQERKHARVCEVAIAFLLANWFLHPRTKEQAPSRAEEEMIVDMGKLTRG